MSIVSSRKVKGCEKQKSKDLALSKLRFIRQLLHDELLNLLTSLVDGKITLKEAQREAEYIKKCIVFKRHFATLQVVQAGMKPWKSNNFSLNYCIQSLFCSSNRMYVFLQANLFLKETLTMYDKAQYYRLSECFFE